MRTLRRAAGLRVEGDLRARPRLGVALGVVVLVELVRRVDAAVERRAAVRGVVDRRPRSDCSIPSIVLTPPTWALLR